MINIIKSKDNDKIKYTKSLLKTKGRNKEKKFINVEGAYYFILLIHLFQALAHNRPKKICSPIQTPPIVW